ncbi:MAG: HRDC domain-containing protein [Gemmatimonadota bacterium]
MYVDDARGLATLASALDGAERVALDCEAAGYHRYSDRLCLLQLTLDGQTFLVDPLAIDPEPVLGDLLRDPQVEVLMHGADYDVRLLDRDLGIRLQGLFDTQIAAGLVGEESLGLSALLERHLGLKLSKKYQKADWAQRPLPEPMRAYAAHDTAHLDDLAELLSEALVKLGRLDWAQEEFQELEKVRFEANGDQDPVTRVKVARGLDPREVDRLRAGLEWRDALAREMDRAHFRVVGDATLVEAARLSPRSIEEVETLPGMNRALARSRGDALLDALREVDDREDAALRGYPRPPRTGNGQGRPPPEVEERFARLKEVRNTQAKSLGLARGTLLPNSVLQLLAESPPGNGEALAKTPGLRRWQAGLLGNALLEVI